jgi:transposase InsO family protein
VRYTAIRYGQRLAESGIERSVGCIGDFYDNALAESVNALYKKELIARKRAMEFCVGGNIDDCEVVILVQSRQAPLVVWRCSPAGVCLLAAAASCVTVGP